MLKNIGKILKEAFVKFYEYRFRIIIGAVVLAIILNIMHFNFNQSVASVTISLNYSQASQGLNPNSTRFSIYEFTCNEVLENTIEDAGLTGVLTVDELKDAIQIHPADRSEMQNNDKYVCTTYNITYTNPGSVKGITTLNMLEIYCAAYKEYFVKNYGDNSAVIDYDSSYFQDPEPFLELSGIKLKATQILRYAEQRIAENTSYTDPDTGDNFLSIRQELKKLIDYDIPNTFGFIRESGVSEDKASFIATLEYKNKISKMTYDTNMAYYESDNYGIDIYDEVMSGIVLVPTVDADDKYYMSRTETAIDTMADNARDSLVLANEIKKEIADTAHTVNQIKAVELTDANMEKAVNMITELDKRIADITKRLQILNTSYISYKTHGYLTFKYSTATFLQSVDLMLTAVELIIYILICYIAAIIFTYRPKQEKESIKA